MTSPYIAKEYFLSRDVNLEVRVMISALDMTQVEEDFDSTEMYLTAQVYADGLPMHTVPIFTHSSTKCAGRVVMWNEWMVMPVKYRDLSRNAQLAITIWSVTDEPVGGTTLSLFDNQGVLRHGMQKLVMWPNIEADGGLNTQTNGEQDGLDECFRLEKIRETYERGEITRVSWLDRLTFAQMEDIDGQDVPDFGKQQKMFLTVEFPFFGSMVVMEEETYNNASAPRVGFPVQTPQGKAHDALAGSGAWWAQHLVVVDDPDLYSNNPVENKYRRLARDMLRGLIDPNLKPNTEERARLSTIIVSPNYNLTNEEKDLLWKFRFSLTDNKMALTKFLLCVDWNEEQEVKQATELLNKWAPIDIAAALRLLGREREFKHSVVRVHAVKTLERSSDDELIDYLLQLVQALRYEPDSGRSVGEDGMLVGHGSKTGEVVSPLASFLVQRSIASKDFSNFLYWYLHVEMDAHDETTVPGRMYRTVFRKFREGMQSDEQAHHTYLMIKRQDAFISEVAAQQRRAKDSKGRKNEKEENLRKYLESDVAGLKTGEYVHLPLEPTIKVTGVRANTAKIFKSVMYPAVIEFKTMVEEEPASSSSSSSSSLASSDAQKDRDGASARGSSSIAESVTSYFGAPSQKKEGSYTVIFKSGDDLRQDQLIMQMIGVMDKLLKRLNFDLKLTPFRVLATSTQDGLMEFVANSHTVSSVLARHDNNILAFFRSHYPSPGAEYGVDPEVLDTYVKSTAGYCVITYLLGIGDRHLDNLMLKPTGHLFHLDFGYIFGRDPKPYPPPFKLTREMVDGMGGLESEHYQRFQVYCCQAYNWLRKSASLILNLLNLMVDAGIEDLSTDADATLLKVQEKFRLDLSDEEAEHWFIYLITESVSALFPRMMEILHRGAVALR